MLLILAWRNIWRNRNRSLITISAIASFVLLAIVTVSLQQGVWDNLVKNLVSLYTGYAQVHGKDYWEEQTLENSFEINEQVDQLVQQTPGVRNMTHRLESFALASSGEKTRGCLVVGIDPVHEDSLTRLSAKIHQGDMLKPGEEAALVAEGLAEKLNLGLGDTIVLLTQGYYGSTAAMKVAIKGLLHFGSPELNQRVAYVPLALAQYWLDANKRATALVVGLTNADQLPAVARTLKKALPDEYEAMTWQEMMPEINQHIEADSAGMYIMLGVLYLLISFGIFSTLLMMLAERQREFGMLNALGMPLGKIARVVLAETIFLTLVGCLVGVALSYPAVWYLVEHPIVFTGELAKTYEKFGFEPIFPAIMKARIFIEQGLTVLIIGFVLAIYPVWRVMHLEAVVAMRK
ncbi:MAG: ABC transporter permease [Bacteroidetes bacterium]|nr:MAG: ABC transporter permease [Bacteroidota bacterium]